MTERIEFVDGDVGWSRAEALDKAVYPPEVMATVPWRDVTWAHADKRVLVSKGDTLVCHVGIYLRDGTHDGAAVRIAGIGGVMTSAGARRSGNAGHALRLAADFMKEQGIDFGLLFCEPHNVRFYGNLGWKVLEGEVWCEQPAGRVRFDMMPAMFLPLARPITSGVIDLCGLPW